MFVYNIFAVLCVPREHVAQGRNRPLVSGKGGFGLSGLAFLRLELFTDPAQWVGGPKTTLVRDGPSGPPPSANYR